MIDARTELAVVADDGFRSLTLKNGCELCSSMLACRCPQILSCWWWSKYADPSNVIPLPASGMMNNPGHPSADKNSSAFSRVGKRPSSR